MLKEVSVALRQNSTYIFDANAKELAEARGKIAEPLYKRLVLNESKLRDVIAGIEQISEMEDPVGRLLEERQLDEGLILRKVQTPIGVLAVIYESRPDAGPQIAALAISCGNAVLLKGGREAAHSNAALGERVRSVLHRHAVDDRRRLVSTPERSAAFLEMDAYN